ncbi:MAG: hypothetical protein HYR96_04335 [Deltaproteobacteria bacterium]|nr:hypothetical protein [Deltaproteobacteria bacterium]MBI3295408.1 hypothetical protein [Deltaproteobacteria bacterium]
MTPKELKARLENGENICVLDVRELEEWNFSNIGGKHIPLGDLPTRVGELNPNDEIAVLCHHGVRSAHAVGFLRQSGFTNVQNIQGGIEAWSLTVDSSVPRY